MTITLLSFSEARAIHAQDLLDALVDWTQSYLLAGHADLGRGGAVCPFTGLARDHDTLRLAICPMTASDEESVHALVGWALQAVVQIPAAADAERYQVIMLGFPNCSDVAGVAMLQRAARRHRFNALFGGRMMGLLYPGSKTAGLWNRAFRPLRSPFPIIAVRRLVEQDAPFIARQHLQWAPYLLRFGWRGARRLRAYRRLSGSIAGQKAASPQ